MQLLLVQFGLVDGGKEFAFGEFGVSAIFRTLGGQSEGRPDVVCHVGDMLGVGRRVEGV